MAPKLPTTLLSRTTTVSPSSPCTASTGQIRHATFVPRSRRPYTFTQLIQLSDGSTYTSRTTSPLALFKSTKDTRNHALWQPSDTSLRNVEVDEAGKLAGFRARFGRGWDLDAGEETAVETEGDGKVVAGEVKKEKKAGDLMDHDSFADLISGYAAQDENVKKAGGLSAKEQARLDSKKKKR